MKFISLGYERGRNSLQNDTLQKIVTLLFNPLLQSELRHLTALKPLRSNCLKNNGSREPLEKLKNIFSFFRGYDGIFKDLFR